MKARIYRARDHTGILAAVEDGRGDCYIGYFSTVSRKMRQADLRSGTDPKETIRGTNPKERSWDEVQEHLDEYAQEHKLKELPLTIGGQI